jgi:hypothetical protein
LPISDVNKWQALRHKSPIKLVADFFGFYFFNEKISDLMFLTKKDGFIFLMKKHRDQRFWLKKNVFFYFFNEKHRV